MKNRKAQISMNTIVYVAIDLFILVIIIMFATGSLQDLFTSISSRTEEIDAIKGECKIDCQNARAAVNKDGWGEWATSSYCTDKHPVDVDNNKDTPDEYLNCWDDPILRGCSVKTRTADEKTMLCATPLYESEEDGINKGDLETCECKDITS